jgi:C-3',4' desaturase CrtD
VVVGAGVGGLSAAAALAHAGLDVTVLEAHVYAGGCAGTFYHQGYRFDAGATLAGGFYPGGPMDLLAAATGCDPWPARPAQPAMVVHLPDGTAIPRWGDDRRHEVHRRVFGEAGRAFWQWQERTADALWDLALRRPAWPPQTAGELAHLLTTARRWLMADPAGRLRPALLRDALRPVAVHLRGASEALRRFVDAQLLIAAQTTADHANALYAAAALDLPRRGVVHLQGGMGAIADTLVRAIRHHGGRVLFRQAVKRIDLRPRGPTVITTARDHFIADMTIVNLPPWNIAALMGEVVPPRLRRLPPLPADGWGAFVVYVGFAADVAPVDLPLHHQVIAGEPPAEGNTVFLSLTPPWDAARAPVGHRGLTLSTHTRLGPWWELWQHDREAYEQRRRVYTERLLTAAERVLPGLREAAGLILPGTPITFARFTGRHQGWVGGFPQTSLWRTWPPRLAPGLWMVGDSIFPGQSTAAVALGGLRVAAAIAHELGTRLVLAAEQPSPSLQPGWEVS